MAASSYPSLFLPPLPLLLSHLLIFLEHRFFFFFSKPSVILPNSNHTQRKWHTSQKGVSLENNTVVVALTEGKKQSPTTRQDFRPPINRSNNLQPISTSSLLSRHSQSNTKLPLAVRSRDRARSRSPSLGSRLPHLLPGIYFEYEVDETSSAGSFVECWALWHQDSYSKWVKALWIGRDAWKQLDKFHGTC
ncbi:uncharacterized protein B0T23DRAFT_25662 [Neurospora hispaniola]|uniref:Uncharacterized protein n=1 Tax=Neurospora hispaniola TaxID=588809 RepID=A0AAJ0IGF6_9PEZI|nr:hypothetical protein B0T23DRAFT_25662 [Neurospora hispaniola]